MGRIDVVFGPSAVRDIKKMSREGQQCIIALAEALREVMRPPGAEKIQGHPQFFRVRQGNFRLVYCPLSEERAVVLVASDRKEAYRNLSSLDDKLEAAMSVLGTRKRVRKRG